MIITTDLIKSLNPCKSGLDNFLIQYGHYWKGTHREFAALDNITYGDKRWVLERVHIQKFGQRPSSGILLETYLCLLDNCDKQEEIKTKAAPMFQVGDKISAFGVEGVVVSGGYASPDFPIKCNFVTGHSALFRADGKYESWHIVPSLKLIERPKKKIKTYMVLYQRGVDFIVSSGRYKSEEDFRMHNINELDFKFIQLIKESEIEVEE